MAAAKVSGSSLQKPLKMSHQLVNGHEAIKFDVQLLLERESLSETWNRLMKKGVLLDHANLAAFSNKISIGSSGSAGLQCVCCEVDCDTKCKATGPGASTIMHLETVAKKLNCWTWQRNPCKY